MSGPDPSPYASFVEMVFPVDDATIKRQIAHSLSLGLREAVDFPQSLNIVATGPSARNLPKRLHGPTLAVNGALEFYPEPDFYAACDPQALVADFLAAPPPSCTYYIASKCHERVFRALKHRDVRLWHVDDHVPGGIACAPSITLTALNLFLRMGWRKFDVYGWDCCFGGDGAHHAGTQPDPMADEITLEVNGRPFRTTSTWWGEADSASTVLAVMDFLGVEVTIHGDGMVKAFREPPIAPPQADVASPQPITA